jgi:hypothetical protein
VYLRGVNWQDFLETSTGDFMSAGQSYNQLNPNWSNASVQATCAQWQSQGFNFIRTLIPCDWWLSDSAITYQGGSTAIGMRDAITDFVQIAQSYGLYIEICPWEIVGYPESGEPSDLPWLTSGQTVITTEAQFVSFWAGTSTSVANVLGGYPNVLFSLFNEPEGDLNTWLAASQLCINAIRNVSQDCIVCQYGYCGGFDDIYGNITLSGTNLIYDTHIYRGGSNTFSTQYTTSDLNSTLYNTWDYGSIIGIHCFMIDEIGCNIGATNELTYYSNMLALLDLWGGSYAGWVYEPGTSGDALIQGSAFPYSLNIAGLELAAAIQAQSTGVIFSNIAASTNIAGTSCTFNCYLSAINGTISSYIFSSTNSGSWVNGSAVSVGAASSWANVTLTLTSTSGVVVSYEWYAIVSVGTSGSSGVFTLETVPSASVLFMDSFQSGSFNMWTGTYYGNGGSVPSVQSNVVYSTNTYAAEMGGGSSMAYSGCYKTLSSTYSTLYARVYVLFSAMPSSGNDYETISIATSADANDLVALWIYSNGGVLTWQLQYYTNSGSQTANYVTPTLTANTWYCVELMEAAASINGQVALWVNGGLVGNITGLTNNGILPQEVDLTANTPAGQSSINVYYDDCEIATMGPIGTSVTSTSQQTLTTAQMQTVIQFQPITTQQLVSTGSSMTYNVVWVLTDNQTACPSTKFGTFFATLDKSSFLASS